MLHSPFRRERELLPAVFGQSQHVQDDQAGLAEEGVSDGYRGRGKGEKLV